MGISPTLDPWLRLVLAPIGFGEVRDDLAGPKAPPRNRSVRLLWA